MTEFVIHDIIVFLSNYKWIYDFKWTEIYSLGQWEKLPISWIKFFKDIDFNKLKKLLLCDFSFLEVPEDIQNYFKFHNNIVNLIETLPSDFNHNFCLKDFKKINPKKSHELMKISSFIRKHHKKPSLKVLDIGSGLGHLARHLGNNFKFKCDIEILAVEGNPDLHLRNQCSENVQKLQFFITEDNLVEFNEKIEEISPKIDLITGLHCCGKLSSLILQFFANFSSADSLLLFSCCYHRMFQQSLTGFPLSDIYKRELSNGNIDFISPAFLRLGCQERKETWLNWSTDDFYHHRYSVAFRCALESYSVGSDEDLSKLKRIKIKRKNLSEISFMDFAGCQIAAMEIRDKGRFLEMLEAQNKVCHWYSVMLALQASIQEIIEYFILLDRVLYLRQFPSVESVKLIRVFEPLISPRNIGIFVSKC